MRECTYEVVELHRGGGVLQVLSRILNHVGPAALTENDPKSAVSRAVLASAQSSSVHLSQEADRIIKLVGWQGGKAAA